MKNLTYGRNPALSFLKEHAVKEAYLQTGFSDKRILDLLNAQKIKVMYLSKDELSKLSNTTSHQGIAVSVERFEYSNLDEVIANSKKQKQPLLLILDSIVDPHNLGAIIRSADAFNVDGIIIRDKRQVDVNATVSKVSAGALPFMKISKVSNLNNLIARLKKEGYWIYAADGNGGVNYNEVIYDRPIALIMGNEGDGISSLVLKNSDFRLMIPMNGHVGSLNVSVATGILLSRIRNV